jgi:hypothetical protein
VVVAAQPGVTGLAALARVGVDLAAEPLSVMTPWMATRNQPSARSRRRWPCPCARPAGSRFRGASQRLQSPRGGSPSQFGGGAGAIAGDAVADAVDAAKPLGAHAEQLAGAGAPGSGSRPASARARRSGRGRGGTAPRRRSSGPLESPCDLRPGQALHLIGPRERGARPRHARAPSPMSLSISPDLLERVPRR